MPEMSLNERAASARMRAGLTPQEAADQIKCSRPTILRWEKDADSIGADYLFKAAGVYKVRPDWLAMQVEDDGWPWPGFVATEEPPASQPLTQKSLRLALQLVAQELAIKRRKLPPDTYAEVVTLLYEQIEEGVPEARLLRFVRAAVG